MRFGGNLFRIRCRSGQVQEIPGRNGEHGQDLFFRYDKATGGGNGETNRRPRRSGARFLYSRGFERSERHRPVQTAEANLFAGQLGGSAREAAVTRTIE